MKVSILLVPRFNPMKIYWWEAVRRKRRKNTGNILFVDVTGRDKNLAVGGWHRVGLGSNQLYLGTASRVCDLNAFSSLWAYQHVVVRLGVQIGLVQQHFDEGYTKTYIVNLNERHDAEPFQATVGVLVGLLKHSPGCHHVSVRVIGGGFNSLHGRLKTIFHEPEVVVYEQPIHPTLTPDQAFAIIEL